MEKEIKVLGIVELFEKVLNISIEESIAMSYEKETKLVKDWAEKNNYLVYSEPRENFFKWKAIRLARKYNYDGVILENLS